MNHLAPNPGIDGSSQLDFSRCLHYYQGLLHMCLGSAELCCVSESIRALHQLKCFNYLPQHDDVFKLLDEHELLLLLLAQGMVPCNDSLIESILDSLELLHAIKTTQKCDSTLIESEVARFRHIRVFQILWTCVDDLNQAFLSPTEKTHLATKRILGKISRSILLCKQLSYTPMLMGLIDLERQLRLCKESNLYINAEIFNAFYQVFLSLLYKLKNRYIDQSDSTYTDTDSKPLLQALTSLHNSFQNH